MYLKHRCQVEPVPGLPLPPALEVGREKLYDKAWRCVDWVMWQPTNSFAQRCLRVVALGACPVLLPLLAPMLIVALAASPILAFVGRYVSGFNRRDSQRAPFSLLDGPVRSRQPSFLLLQLRKRGRYRDRFVSGASRVARSGVMKRASAPKLESA
jgi:hypothetical protein